MPARIVEGASLPQDTDSRKARKASSSMALRDIFDDEEDPGSDQDEDGDSDASEEVAAGGAHKRSRLSAEPSGKMKVSRLHRKQHNETYSGYGKGFSFKEWVMIRNKEMAKVWHSGDKQHCHVRADAKTAKEFGDHCSKALDKAKAREKRQVVHAHSFARSMRPTQPPPSLSPVPKHAAEFTHSIRTPTSTYPRSLRPFPSP
mmetsp:Transcript_65169/g.128926  ORF Transcript_65169/g.128926 Transcript_65169/m.128926 type:complete len:202 (-) Transcript_65169:1397-2002(-)